VSRRAPKLSLDARYGHEYQGVEFYGGDVIVTLKRGALTVNIAIDGDLFSLIIRGVKYESQRLADRSADLAKIVAGERP